jgi:hypothetical protein
MNQVVEHLPDRCQVLSSNISSAKNTSIRHIRYRKQGYYDRRLLIGGKNLKQKTRE